MMPDRSDQTIYPKRELRVTSFVDDDMLESCCLEPKPRLIQVHTLYNIELVKQVDISKIKLTPGEPILI